MGKKQKRKIARALVQAQIVNDRLVVADKWNKDLREDVGRKRHEIASFRSHYEHQARRYHQELARYKFIDEILEKMSKDPEFRGMPLFQYMRGEKRSLMPMMNESFRDCFPPFMRQAVMPEITWNLREIAFNDSPAREMVADVLTYHMLYCANGWTGPAPVVHYECNGESRAYILPKTLAYMPEADALMIVMREIAPAVLAMFKELKDRG